MRIIILLCSILFIAGCAVSAHVATLTNPPISDIRPDDFQVEYYWETGSLPPPYFYTYTITVGPGARGEIVFQADYKDEDPPIWSEVFEIQESDLDLLYTQLFEMGMFENTWQQVDDIPDGGSADKLSVMAYERVFSIPSYVDVKQRARDAREVYDYINSLVP